MKRYGAFLLLLLMLSCLGCRRNTLEELEFFTARNLAPEVLDLDEVRLRGNIDGLSRTVIDSCGFVWSFDLAAVQTLGTNVRRLRANVPTNDEDFSALYPPEMLQQGKTFFFRAFAASGERIFYAPTVENYSFGEVVALTGLPAQVINNTAQVRGRITGLKAAGAELQAHGHTWSATDHTPSIEEDCDSTDLGVLVADKDFSSLLEKGLLFNTRYFVRAYARSEGRTWYSATTDTVEIRDGWQKVGVFFPYHEGAGVGADAYGRAFLGFGCELESGCELPDLNKRFWEYDPTTHVFTEKTSFPGLVLRSNGATVAMLDTVYHIFGEYFDPVNNVTVTVRDFLQYSISADTWTKKTVPASMSARSRAVAFALTPNLYTGTGNKIGAAEPAANDFWQYAPAKGAWRKVAGLPLRLATEPNKTFYKGRYEAVAFTVDGIAYVGGGRTESFLLKDFWKFVPPLTDAAQDTGRWEFVGFFPGVARAEAVAFSINGRGYYGMGVNTTEGYLDDFWEFDPATELWRARFVFPGGKRQETIGFSLLGSGYVIGGLERTVAPNGVQIKNTLRDDVWRYVPEKQ